MKRTLLFISVFALSIFNGYATVQSGKCGASVNYTLDTETGVLNISGTGAMDDYVSWGGTTVPWGSILIKSSITSIVVEDGVTRIGNRSFDSFDNLTSVTIPKSVTSIGDNAFSYCKSLASFELSNSITSIGKYAFCNCTALTSIKIPGTVTSMEDRAFSGCSMLSSLTIEEGVSYIGNYAFERCFGLTKVNIPNSVSYIGNYAFNSCWNIVSLSLGINIVSIGDYAFSGCNGLSDITLPNTLTAIGNVAFGNCYNINSITIPGSVTNIGSSAFSNCFVTEDNFTNNSILDAAANNYWGLKIVDTKDYGFCISGDELLKYIGMDTEIVIPEDITVIGDNAFNGNYNITSIILPPNLKSIGKTALGGLDKLTTIEIPDGVINIGEWALYKTGLTSITFPSSMSQIESHVLAGCGQLVSIVIPSSIKTINTYAFESISSLTDFYNYAQTPQTIESNVFSNYSATLHVPAAALETYRTTSPWSEFGNIVALDDEPVIEGIAINETNFPDENFRKWVLNSFGKDGVLTEDEIAKVDKISFTSEVFQSLKGIEYFTALGTLNFCDSPITTLDVSKNTELTYLGCSNCQLTSLDVSNNTKLTYLSCDRNNLTSLEVSQNTALKNLSIYSNQIKGAEMDALVESLPTVSGGTMYVIYNTDEQNEMTTTQVAAALAKGWTPKYMVNGRWQDYAGSEPDLKKCATPIVDFYGGKLIFRCETEDVKYVCKVSDIEFETDGTDVSMPSRITISVYAKKEGYEPSDTITYEIDSRVLMGIIGDVNNDGKVNGTDIQEVINIIVNKSEI